VFRPRNDRTTGQGEPARPAWWAAAQARARGVSGDRVNAPYTRRPIRRQEAWHAPVRLQPDVHEKHVPLHEIRQRLGPPAYGTPEILMCFRSIDQFGER